MLVSVQKKWKILTRLIVGVNTMLLKSAWTEYKQRSIRGFILDRHSRGVEEGKRKKEAFV